MTRPRHAGRRRPETAAPVVLGLLLSGGLVWNASDAALRATVSNTSNLRTGQVLIGTTPASSTALFPASTPLMQPGSTAEACLRVTYSGDVNAQISMLASPGTAHRVESYVDLTVTEGSALTATDGTCGGFVALTPASAAAVYPTAAAPTNTTLAQLRTAGPVNLWTASTTTTRFYKVVWFMKATDDALLPSPTPAATQAWTLSLTWQAVSA